MRNPAVPRAAVDVLEEIVEDDTVVLHTVVTY